MFPDEMEARKTMVHFSHKTQAHGFVSVTDGNLSIRLDEKHILITPSSFRKEDMTIEAPVIIDMEGNLVQGAKKPSTEYKVHLEAYRQRPDVKAVIHAHPPRTIAFSLTDSPFDTCILPEVVVVLGNVPIAPYAAPSTDALPESMRDLIKESDAVILARHGTVTVGATLEEAFNKLEKLEHNAEILIYSHILGGAKPFSASELVALNDLRSFYGVTTKAKTCAVSGVSAPAAPPFNKVADAVPPGTWTPTDPGVFTRKYASPASPQEESQAPTYHSRKEAELNALVGEITARVQKRT